MAVCGEKESCSSGHTSELNVHMKSNRQGAGKRKTRK